MKYIFKNSFYSHLITLAALCAEIIILVESDYAALNEFPRLLFGGTKRGDIVSNAVLLSTVLLVLFVATSTTTILIKNDSIVAPRYGKKRYFIQLLKGAIITSLMIMLDSYISALIYGVLFADFKAIWTLFLFNYDALLPALALCDSIILLQITISTKWGHINSGLFPITIGIILMLWRKVQTWLTPLPVAFVDYIQLLHVLFCLYLNILSALSVYILYIRGMEKYAD